MKAKEITKTLEPLFKLRRTKLAQGYTMRLIRGSLLGVELRTIETKGGYRRIASIRLMPDDGMGLELECTSFEEVLNLNAEIEPLIVGREYQLLLLEWKPGKYNFIFALPTSEPLTEAISEYDRKQDDVTFCDTLNPPEATLSREQRIAQLESEKQRLLTQKSELKYRLRVVRNALYELRNYSDVSTTCHLK